jgi:prepilin-type N-terminal cleavage/methylation domain-containing protein/prepilin-type processing-associated H-X9-DG protein
MLTRPKRGFTVVELLVVIAIIGVLVALLMPAVQMAREAARRTQCQNNLSQCGKAIQLYATSKGHLPASRTVVQVGKTTYVFNWVYPVLPELEQSAVHAQLRSNTYLDQPLTIRSLVCPSQPKYESPDFPLSYVVNGGRANYTNAAANIYNRDWIANGVFIDKGDTTIVPPATTAVGTTSSPDKHRMEEIAKYDGTSNTLMLSENPNVGEWLNAAYGPSAISKEQYSQMLWFPQGYQRSDPSTGDPAPDPLFDSDQPPPPLPPVNYACGLNRSAREVDKARFDSDIRYARPASYHPGGFNVTFCDGSVHWWAETVDYGVYAVLMTSRGERINDPANSTFTTANPTWQWPLVGNYPGVKFE